MFAGIYPIAKLRRNFGIIKKMRTLLTRFFGYCGLNGLLMIGGFINFVVAKRIGSDLPY